MERASERSKKHFTPSLVEHTSATIANHTGKSSTNVVLTQCRHWPTFTHTVQCTEYTHLWRTDGHWRLLEIELIPQVCVLWCLLWAHQSAGRFSLTFTQLRDNLWLLCSVKQARKVWTDQHRLLFLHRGRQEKIAIFQMSKRKCENGPKLN